MSGTDFSDGNQTGCPTLKKLIMASHYAKTTPTVFIYVQAIFVNFYYDAICF
jgi:hypothetical protein